MDNQLEQLIKDRNVLVAMRFGSHLYGLDTPESDLDIKGIYIPTAEEILLQKIPKSINITPKKSGPGIKNGPDAVDIELYNLQYFIELCLKGETVGVDMLHCNDENLVYCSNHSLWDWIQGERSKFYSKNLSMLVSYCRKQASKYGCKGSRISDARRVIQFLYNYNVNIDRVAKLSDVWDDLPEGEHIKFVPNKKTDEIHFQVCGVKFQKTQKISYVIGILENFIKKYGHRALLAEQNLGIDFKAVSHAVRYAEQLQELFETGNIKFPLKNADFIKQIKAGKLDYTSIVAPYLDTVIEGVEKLAEESDFPIVSDRNPWEKFIETYHRYVVEQDV